MRLTAVVPLDPGLSRLIIGGQVVCNCKKLAWCTERVGWVIDFWVAFSDVVIIVRRLAREGWSRYRWVGRPSRRPRAIMTEPIGRTLHAPRRPTTPAAAP